MNELPEVYYCAQPKARQEHKCCECQGVILAGEKYHRHQGIWDGRPETYKVCADCETLRKELDREENDPEMTTGLGGLCEAIFEGDAPLIQRFLSVKRKRRATLAPWMTKHDLVSG